MKFALLNSAAGEVELALGEGSLEAYHVTQWQEGCLEERGQKAQDHSQFKMLPH